MIYLFVSLFLRHGESSSVLLLGSESMMNKMKMVMAIMMNIVNEYC